MNGFGSINGAAINVIAINAEAVLSTLSDIVSLFDDEAIFDLYISGKLSAKVVACHGANTPADERPPQSRYVPVCRQRN